MQNTEIIQLELGDTTSEITTMNLLKKIEENGKKIVE